LTLYHIYFAYITHTQSVSFVLQSETVGS